jgi:hypothetical protein
MELQIAVVDNLARAGIRIPVLFLSAHSVQSNKRHRLPRLLASLSVFSPSSRFGWLALCRGVTARQTVDEAFNKAYASVESKWTNVRLSCVI